MNNQLIDVVGKLSIEFPLSDYTWDFDNPPVEIPIEISTSLDRNVYLRTNFKSLLERDTSLDHSYWIINTWGRVNAFVRNEKNDALIRGIDFSLTRGELRPNESKFISSLSKIAAFQYPSIYSIYNPRTIFTLNWLLLKYSNTRVFFPQTLGGGKITSLDLPTIMRLANVTFTYHRFETAYFEFCRLMNLLANEIYGNAETPYKVEMLLFHLINSFVKSDIHQSIEMKIKTAKDNSKYSAI